MTNPVTCIGCGATLKNKLVAFSDAKWEKLKGKPLCRECAYEVARLVLDEYA
ncbi:MAG: hypothetical protein HY376_03250 [Candidatus Blackburnbacteria bacterium]|nr:hypothetical protein [Candidatus Blackburnbacteria bacterium]